jgi:hypothetical protein
MPGLLYKPVSGGGASMINEKQPRYGHCKPGGRNNRADVPFNNLGFCLFDFRAYRRIDTVSVFVSVICLLPLSVFYHYSRKWNSQTMPDGAPAIRA